MSEMRLAYVTTYDATDIGNWSGLGYYIARSLENQSISLEYTGPLRQKLSLMVAAREYLYNRFLNRRYLLDREPVILKHYAYQVSAKLAGRKDIDIVFSPGTIPIAYLECDQPIVFWTDATFAGMIDFYPTFSNMCKRTIRNGNIVEASALKKCKLAIYSSEWAAETAKNYYKIDPSKVKVVPFGANVEHDTSFDDLREIVSSRRSNKCKLSFIALDWSRKGGNLALAVVKELNRMGLDSELTVIGCQPAINEPLPKFVKCFGRLDKSKKEDLDKINRALRESHFLILPSRADSSPVVFSEANSWGVPCLSTNVGGIPTVIKDGLNGKLFSKDAGVTEYCTYIVDLFADYSKYKDLALSSFNEYQSRLNWQVAGQTVKELMTELTPIRQK